VGPIRIAIVVVRNARGDFFVHRRRADKRVFPGLYGLGAGGRIEPHETPEQGARRELREETGIDAAPTPVEAFAFVSGGVPYTVHLYEVRHEGPIAHCEAEWSDSGWETAEQVGARLQRGELCPDTAACLLRLDPRGST
jgi:8-oxo-dGTP pyrophosphatase MutT (NUDIX family)